MRSRNLAGPRLLRTALVILALLLLPGMVMAQEVITVQLDSVGESGVSGTATLTAAGDGTQVELDIKGLAPGTDARGSMHAGMCAIPSASFAALPDLKATETGTATATGSVLFHGTENVALAIMVDGEHIIAIQAGGQVVACGTIPKLAPEGLPMTGAEAISFGTAVAVGLGLCALSAGLFLRQRSQPLHRS
jgi:hypothetical protein